MTGDFRKSMAWLHTWSGLVVSWLLFFIFFTGSAGYFDTEIDRWMQPERPVLKSNLDELKAINMAEDYLIGNASSASQWRIALPINRNSIDLRVSWNPIDVDSGQILSLKKETLSLDTADPVTYRSTAGGQQLYQMHYRFHYLPNLMATIVVGICAMIAVVILTTGVITHRRIFVDFFTFRPNKQRRSWLDFHALIGVLALPFHFMITYSGLVFFTFTLMPLIGLAVYPESEKVMYEDTKTFLVPPVRSDEKALMKPLSFFYEEVVRIRKEEGIHTDGPIIESIWVTQPNDKNAQVRLRVLNQGLAYNDEWIFNAVTGAEIQEARAKPEMTALFFDFGGIHEGLFAGYGLRWLYFFSGLLGAGMIATGMILWVNKRRAKQLHQASSVAKNINVIEKINIATMVGFPAAVAFYFWSNRLIPVDFPSRDEWEIHTLFIGWLVLFVHAFLRPRLKAWKEQLVIAASAYALIPVISMFTTTRGLGVSLREGDWVFISFELSMISMGALFGIVALFIVDKGKSVDIENSNVDSPLESNVSAGAN